MTSMIWWYKYDKKKKFVFTPSMYNITFSSVFNFLNPNIITINFGDIYLSIWSLIASQWYPYIAWQTAWMCTCAGWPRSILLIIILNLIGQNCCIITVTVCFYSSPIFLMCEKWNWFYNSIPLVWTVSKDFLFLGH